MNQSQPRQKRCVYCLDWFSRKEITRDHIFSKSWNPVRKPVQQQWTVAACHSCNNQFGKLEIAVRDRLAICLVPNGPLAKKAITIARKNFNPRQAKTESERRARTSRQQQLFAGARFVGAPKDALPFTLANLSQGFGIAIPQDADNLIRLAQKWTRGVHFRLTKGFIESDYEIRVFHPDEVSEDQLIKMVQPIIKCYDLNPSAQVLHAVIPDDKGREPIHL